MNKCIEDSDFILIVCTETYYQRVMDKEEPGKGLGIKWESTLTFNHLYRADSKNIRFIPILFDIKDKKYIPAPLQGFSYYCVNTEEGYDGLYRHLTDQKLVPKPERGKLRERPPKQRKDDFLSAKMDEPEKTLHPGGKKSGDDNSLKDATIDKAVLRENMANSFSIEDLEILCADIEQDLKNNGINYRVSLEDIGGNTKEAKIMRLIEYLDRRRLLDYLIKAIQKTRPGLI